MNTNPTQQDILGALSKSSTPLTAEAIAAELKAVRSRINIPLNQLIKDGAITSKSDNGGPPLFQVSEGNSAEFELSPNPAPQSPTTASAKPASGKSAAGKPKSKVVDITQASRAKTSAAHSAQPATVEPRLQILQLLDSKPQSEEQLSSIEGYERILGDLIASDLVSSDEIFGELTFKLTTQGRQEYPKSFFADLPKPGVATASSPSSSSAATHAVEAPVKRKRGRPSKQEVAAREAAAAAANGVDSSVGDGQRASAPEKNAKPAKAPKPAKAAKPAKAKAAQKPADPAPSPIAAEKPKRGRPSKAELARRAQEAAANGTQAPAGTQAPKAAKPASKSVSPAPAVSEIKRAATPESGELPLNNADMLEFNRLISRVLDEKTQAMRSQNELYRKEAVDLAKSMADIARNMAEISERILKTFG